MRITLTAAIPDEDALLVVAGSLLAQVQQALLDGSTGGTIHDRERKPLGEWSVQPDDEPGTSTEVPVRNLTVGTTIRYTDESGVQHDSPVGSVSPALFGAFEVYTERGDTLFLTHRDDTVEVAA